MPIAMLPEKIQDNFYGKHFCGVRGGDRFVSVQRPVATNGSSNSEYACPEDFMPCSAATNDQNTICIAKSKDKEQECPITLMKFVTNKDTYESNSAYKV